MGKVDFILMNKNGFFWIETLVSLSIVMIVVSVIIPLHATIKQEKRVLHDRTIISLYLFDELQNTLFIQSDKSERTQSKNISNRHVTITFNRENELIKGCVNWENVKGRSESLCLYGISEQ